MPEDTNSFAPRSPEIEKWLTRLGWEVNSRQKTIHQLVALQDQLQAITFNGKTTKKLFDLFEFIEDALEQSHDLSSRV